MRRGFYFLLLVHFLGAEESVLGPGIAAIEAHRWYEAARFFDSHTGVSSEAFYFLGVAYFEQEEFEYANEAFSRYLRADESPRFFERAIEYKFRIAEKFRSGVRRHLLGYKMLPKWVSAYHLALEIYDEVTAMIPVSELGVQALLGKAELLCIMGDFRESIDTFHMVIARYAHTPEAARSFVRISEIYLHLAKKEEQNSDILGFASVNLKRFIKEFPGDPNITKVEGDVRAIREHYAKMLFETGNFYERMGEKRASEVYYQRVLSLFADTEVAERCRTKLS